MSKRDSKLLIEDMLEAISKINSYIGQESVDEFRRDDKTVDAVIRNLEIIGEAANHIPDSIKEGSEDINWGRIVGLRNRVIHEYFGVDLNIIWKIVKKDLPKLDEQLKNLRKNLPE